MIKIVALLFMLIDHIGQVFFPNSILFTLVGRIAFPLFAWELANGFKRTKNFKLYILRISILAIVTQPFYSLLFNNGYFNICFTLLGSLLILKVIENDNWQFRKIIFSTLLIYFIYGLNVEYGIYGICVVLSFYFIENAMLLIIVQLILSIISLLIMGYSEIQLISVFSILFIESLKKYDFKCNKILTYSFYPIHILCLLIIKYYFCS